MKITIDGREHPVTAAWHAQNIAPYPELAGWTFSQLETEKQRLLHQSQQAAEFLPGVAYTAQDEARLQAITRVQNAHRATRVILHHAKGARALSEFGFDGVDQIHGNAHTHECGCVLHVVFDHHKAQAAEPHDHHPHYPLKVCDGHAHLAGDFRAHYAAVKEAAKAAQP